MTSLDRQLCEALQDLPPAKTYCLAFSGGLDSTVLLHLLLQRRPQLPARLLAAHVHHGLYAQADAWERHCRRLCHALEVPYVPRYLRLRPKPGESLEALARERRYRALAALLQPGDVLLTAQHQDDQAETLLLQLLRGGGPAGLAAMPRVSRFGEGWLARPLLDVSRRTLETYAEQHRLSWVEDTSNQDLRFDRNYLRHRIIPLLHQRWPAASATLARSARLSGECKSLLDEQVARDLDVARGPWPGTLSISALRSLSSPRRRHLLRHWIHGRAGVIPGSRHLQRIETDCLQSRMDAQPVVGWSDVRVRRHRDALFLLRTTAAHDSKRILPWRTDQPLVLPAGLGELVSESAARGLSETRWRQARVEIRFRRGGERCRPAGAAHHKRLKKLFQEWAVPPWWRDRVPLIYLDRQFAAIPDRLVCEPFQAEAGERAIAVHWRHDMIDCWLS